MNKKFNLFSDGVREGLTFYIYRNREAIARLIAAMYYYSHPLVFGLDDRREPQTDLTKGLLDCLKIELENHYEPFVKENVKLDLVAVGDRDVFGGFYKMVVEEVLEKAVGYVREMFYRRFEGQKNST